MNRDDIFKIEKQLTTVSPQVKFIRNEVSRRNPPIALLKFLSKVRRKFFT